MENPVTLGDESCSYSQSREMTVAFNFINKRIVDMTQDIAAKLMVMVIIFRFSSRFERKRQFLFVQYYIIVRYMMDENRKGISHGLQSLVLIL